MKYKRIPITSPKLSPRQLLLSHHTNRVLEIVREGAEKNGYVTRIYSDMGSRESSQPAPFIGLNWEVNYTLSGEAW